MRALRALVLGHTPASLTAELRSFRTLMLQLHHCSSTTMAEHVRRVLGDAQTLHFAALQCCPVQAATRDGRSAQAVHNRCGDVIKHHRGMHFY